MLYSQKRIAPDSGLSNHKTCHNTQILTDGRAEGKNESILVRVFKELAREVPGITAGPPGDSFTNTEDQN